jgi:ATP-dependent helicase/DNAse subunit B
MPLSLILGPANSAKAGEVLGGFADAAHRGAILVVPSAADADHYTRELAGDGAVLGSVLTFSGLAEEIARRAGYHGARLLRLQRERLLRRVAPGAPGFTAAAGELIAELQRLLISPERFARAVAAWGKGEGIATLYRAYVDELGRLGRVDGELFAWRALDALRAHPLQWGREPVFFYGFDDLFAIERDAIETLARVAQVDVTLSLTYEPGRPALSARAELVEELRGIAARVEQLPALDEHYHPRSRAALHHLERGLFESVSARIDPGPAVRLLEGGGEQAEAELVAAEVLALLGSGVAAEEIVVVCRSLDRSAGAIERVFESYGIPLGSDRRVPFSHCALGRAVLGLAHCTLLDEERAGAEDLLDYLRYPGVVDRVAVVDALEANVRREGLHTAAAARARLGWELRELGSIRTADSLAQAARRLFASPYRGAAAVLDRDGERDAHALASMLDAFSELDELGEQLSGSELIELLESLEVTAGAPPRAGAVLIAEPLQVRARRFRAVFMYGLGEGEFPRQGAPEPFLSDDQRRELAAASGLRLPAREDALSRERYLFYASISRATEQLVLSYRSSDEEGNLALPSPFIAEVAELLVPEWAERRRRRLLADVVWSPEEAPNERERERARATLEPSISEAPQRMLSDIALAHVRHSEVVSGGALECYADCPVKWLVERELSPARLDPDPDPMVRGSYMHLALEEVMSRLRSPITAESLADAHRMLDEVLVEMPPMIDVGQPKAVREASLRRIEADLRRYLEHEAQDSCAWRPEGLELRFGFDGEEASLGPVILDDGVRLRGVIDRVDVDPSGSGRAIVRDYKSGASRPEHQGAHWQSDRQLQVALYMIAVRQLLRLEPVAGLYQPLGGPDLRARGVFSKDANIGTRLVANDGLDPEELESVLSEASERAVALAKQLRSGSLHPTPETCSRDGCRYPGICRSW